jgi:hypothetical protein
VVVAVAYPRRQNLSVRRRCLCCASPVVVAACVVRNRDCVRRNLQRFVDYTLSVGVGCIGGAAVHESMPIFLYAVSTLRRCGVVFSALESLLYMVLLCSTR